MTVGRPLTYQVDDVLDEAMRVFWLNGFEATSLPALLEAMQLSRSSFYQGFGSKHELFVRCLERYQEQTTALLWGRLAGARSGRDFVADTLAWAIEEAAAGGDPRGCLVLNTAAEFAQRDPQIAALVSRGLERYRAIFAAAVQRGQAEGSIRDDHGADMLADYLVTAMSGLRTMVKAGTDHRSLASMVTVAMHALEPKTTPPTIEGGD